MRDAERLSERFRAACWHHEHLAEFARAVLANQRERWLAMTVREQLAARVAAILAAWGPMRTDWVGWLPRAESATVEVELPGPPPSTIRDFYSRTNAAESCGAPAGHLLFCGTKSTRVDSGAGPRWRVSVHVLCRELPWDHLVDIQTGEVRCLVHGDGWTAYPPADFDALLAALEPGAGPEPLPDRPETWHDRPGLL